MENNNEMMEPKRDLSTITEQYLDVLPVFKMEDAEPDAEFVNARKNVLRSQFRPIMMYLLSKNALPVQEGVALTPEVIIGNALNQPELGFEQQLTEAIKQKYFQQQSGEHPRDWIEEAFNMSMEGKSHPLTKLMQRVIGKMSPELKQQLARSAMRFG